MRYSLPWCLLWEQVPKNSFKKGKEENDEKKNERKSDGAGKEISLA